MVSESRMVTQLVLKIKTNNLLIRKWVFITIPNRIHYVYTWEKTLPTTYITNIVVCFCSYMGMKQYQTKYILGFYIFANFTQPNM